MNDQSGERAQKVGGIANNEKSLLNINQLYSIINIEMVNQSENKSLINHSNHLPRGWLQECWFPYRLRSTYRIVWCIAAPP